MFDGLVNVTATFSVAAGVVSQDLVPEFERPWSGREIPGGFEARSMKQRKRIKWARYVGMYVELLRARGLNADGIAQVERVLDRFSEYRKCGDRWLDQIDSADLQLYIGRRKNDRWRGQSLSVRTLNNEIDILNQCFAKAGPPGTTARSRQNLAYTDHPPAAVPLAALRVEPRIATEEQIRQFVRSFQHARSPKPNVCDPAQFWRAVVLLECTIPLRRRALLGIPRPINLAETRELFLPASLNKTGQDLRFALSPVVAAELARLPTQPGEPLLPWYRRFRDGTRSPNTPGYFNEVMREMQRAAGIEDGERITTKLFRSMVATILSEEFSPHLGRQALGHSPNTHTLETNYLRHRVSQSSHAAADFLTQQALSIVGEPELRVVG